MITWFKRLKEWEQLTIAIVLGVGSVLTYRYLGDLSHANLLAECDRAFEATNNLPDNAPPGELDRRLQRYSDCWDKF